MRHLTSQALAAGVLCAMTGASTLLAQQAALDVILSNGKIKDIKPVLTMVGGKIVYDAAAVTATR